MLYSTAPIAAVVVAVIVVVPALQTIVPAAAETVKGHGEITVIGVLDELSPVLSPVKLPNAVQDVPFPKANPAFIPPVPSAFAEILTIEVLVAPAGITSVLLQIVITPPAVLEVTIQFGDSAFCDPVAKGRPTAEGTLICTLTLCAEIGFAPVFVTVTVNSSIDP
jgi:hypothetical protein